MDEKKILKQYSRWVKRAHMDLDVSKELQIMRHNRIKIEDAFYRDLTFGTGGLRGIMGAGTNRMNVHTVAKASQGVAEYIKKHFQTEERSIAVSYDSRLKSNLFAQTACCVFAANEIRVFLYSRLMPTPCLSFAVRELGCAAGIMITASHNPSCYNGYKVYGADGCQITTETAAQILEEIEKLDIFDDIRTISFEAGMRSGQIQWIPETIFSAFIDTIKKQSLSEETNLSSKDIAIVYSPLNGTGLEPVLQVLKENGYTNLTVVKEQQEPDGRFPTCPYPNPEIKEAMDLGIQYAKKLRADLVFATDPDCDRVGIAVKNSQNNYTLLSGNETGLLLLDYICSRRIAMGIMPKNPVFIKTIVTTAMAEQIASHYGLRTMNVLTGFKFIGEQIGKLESADCQDSFVFGFEESYGYLSGTYIRDKDGVGASLLICEMCAFYKAAQISLLDKLEELYRNYGYCLDTLCCFPFEGLAGFQKMQQIMAKLRQGVPFFGGKKVIGCQDYQNGLDDLPKSDVLRFLLEDNCSVVIRPSGTEPKIKAYISAYGRNRKEAESVEKAIEKSIEQTIAFER